MAPVAITHLYQFILSDGVHIFMREKPPAKIKESLFAEAPAQICAEFEDGALEVFRTITGKHLHSIAVPPGAKFYLRLGQKRAE